jgi:DNA-binding protein HU-beta
MTKQEIVKQIARETGVEAATVLAVVEGFMEEENVFLRGFGTFLIKRRKEKKGRNITKNTTIVIPAHDIPAFKNPVPCRISTVGFQELASEPCLHLSAHTAHH